MTDSRRHPLTVPIDLTSLATTVADRYGPEKTIKILRAIEGARQNAMPQKKIIAAVALGACLAVLAAGAGFYYVSTQQSTSAETVACPPGMEPVASSPENP
jgi:hypothetical protein